MQARQRERKPYRVLVLPGGTEIGLEVVASLGRLKEVELYSGSMDVPTHAPYAYTHSLFLPGVDEPGWRGALESLLSEHEIDFVIPAHDDAVIALAEVADSLPSRVIAPPLETCRIVRRKSLTYELLGDVLPVPGSTDVRRMSTAFRSSRSRIAVRARAVHRSCGAPRRCRSPSRTART